MKLDLTMPPRRRGRLSAADEEKYQRQLKRWCDGIVKIDSQLDFKVSSRGWCYILEEHGLQKGDFDAAQRLINNCRKNGLLPLDICCEDDGRAAEHVEDIDNQTPEEFARDWVAYLRNGAHEQYKSVSFWENLDVYLQMTVEKIDLKSLFSSVCKQFHLPLSNVSGWNDLNSRAGIMRRFKFWEDRGKRIVLLHCGDHDPGGLLISDFIRSNLADLANAEGINWHPDNLEIDRFGLNYKFIQKNRLTWIDNLITGSGGNLADPEHNDHNKPYVQNYLDEFGARKVNVRRLVSSPRLERETPDTLQQSNQQLSRKAMGLFSLERIILGSSLIPSASKRIFRRDEAPSRGSGLL